MRSFKLNKLRLNFGKSFLKNPQHYVEYGLARGCISFLRLLSPEQSSNLGGWICHMIGPLLPVSRIADTNLQLAMPDFDRKKRKEIIRKSWDNLGRTVAEFPHLAQLQENTPQGPGWEVIGSEYLIEQAQQGGPVIFVSGHIGNWEMLPCGVAHYGATFSSFYRAASNPYIDKLILNLRLEAIGQKIPLFPKGAKGAKMALKHLSQGKRIGVLSDQKMNDGIEVRFFDKPAMTASSVAALALRLKCPIIMGYVQRLGPARLQIVVEPPLTNSLLINNRIDDVYKLTQHLNDRLESWIKKQPYSWLWLHKRWPKNFYK